MLIIFLLYNFYTSHNFFLFVISLIFVFHFINIFNFMDGSDGLAITQTFFFLLYFFYFFNISNVFGHNVLFLILPLIVIFYYNLKKQIFLGNSGSYLLGVYAILLLSENYDSLYDIFIWVYIFIFFYIDTSFLILKRLFNKENIFKAHNNHLYQILCKKFGNHKTFLMIYICFNTFMFLIFFIIFNLSISSQIYYVLLILFLLTSIYPYIYYKVKSS